MTGVKTVPTTAITGAANGIGRATANALIEAGHRIAALDIDAEGLSTLAASAPDQVTVARCDISDPGDIERAFDDVESQIDRFTGVVCCAGVNSYADPDSMTVPEWDHFFAIDLRSTWLCARRARRSMVDDSSSSIVVVSSVHARATTQGMFPYASAKAGLEGLVRSLALEWGPSGIRVNAVAPGYTRTDLVEKWLERDDDPSALRAATDAVHALRRIAEPHEVASVIEFLLSDGSTAMTGSTVTVDCGHTARFA